MDQIKHVKQLKGLTIFEKTILYATAIFAKDGATETAITLAVQLILEGQLRIPEDQWGSHDKQLHRRLDAHAKGLYKHLKEMEAV